MQSICSLYLHIPFCVSKCAYCDFFSIPCGRNPVPRNYADALEEEIKYRARVNNIKSWKTVYIGGGTPSLLSSEQLQMIVETAVSCSEKIPEEITVEMNPSDITAEKLSAAERCGVNRISCGIQSFSPAVLSGVNRRSSSDDVKHAAELLKSGFHGIFSADMISALPGETDDSFIEGLGTLLKYTPEHISLYALVIEEKTLLGKSIISGKTRYDYDKADAMWIRGRDFLVSHGYRQYEVSNFCLPGYQSRHNSAYWKLDDYIGCGAGATGTVYGRNDEVSLRYTDTRDIETYTSFWLGKNRCEDSIPEEKELIDRKTSEFEFFMMGLRLREGVCAETYEQRYGEKFPEKAELLFREWQHEGKAEITEREGMHQYALTPEGLLFLNEFLESL